MPETHVPHTEAATPTVRDNAVLTPGILAVGYGFAPWLLADLRQQVADHG
jgi:hypothetical protein